jgi:hypothetical protein
MGGVRATIAIVACSMSAILILGEVVSACVHHRRQRNYSFIPFLPALLGVAGCIVAPWPRSAWFIPLFLIGDPSVPLLVVAVLRGNFRK